MIIGIGSDIIEVDRIERAIKRSPERFLRRVFTPGEIQECAGGEHKFRRLAARFAAKEATLKALGIGLRGVKWTEVEVVRDTLGKPSLHLSGRLREVAVDLQVGALHVSLSHCKEYALAQVVAVQ